MLLVLSPKRQIVEDWRTVTEPFRKALSIEKFVDAACAIALACSLAVLAAWRFQLAPGLTSSPTFLKANGALGLGICALALWLRAPLPNASALRRRAGLALATAAGVLGSLTLIEYAAGFNFGIDEAWVSDPGAKPHPGRMSPLTATGMCALSLAVLLINSSRNAKPRLAELLGGLAASLGFLALAGYFYEAELLYAPSPHVTPISPQSAIMLIPLGLAVIVARPQHGLVSLLLSEEPGSAMLRSLLAPLSALPVVFSSLRLYGEDVGWFDRAFGTGISSVANVFVVCGVLAFSARSINAASAKLRKTQRQHEAQLAQTQRLESLGTLAGGIAHDFNNILTASSGYLELARTRLGSDHAAQRWLSEVARANKRAEELVAQVLAFSRPSVGVRQPVRIETVVEEVVRLLRASLPAMIELRSSSTDEVPPIEADPGQVYQVILNLAVNGSQAMGTARGVLSIETDVVQVRERVPQRVGELVSGRYVRLRVVDQGCGMDSQTLERAFDPFFTTRDPGLGTGLGLSVVLGIVKGHAGAIAAESEPGQGSTFSVYWPVREGLTTVSTAPPSPAPRGNGEHILYVDDERLLVTLTTETLGALDYRVKGHTDPRAALREIESEPEAFDMLITDLAMPGMTGIELAERVHTLRPDLPIMLVSGNLQAEDEQQARAHGVLAVLQKPATLRELPAAIQRLLSARRKQEARSSHS